MTQRPSAWMPLYVADYLADTSHLSTRQHGAYLLLLMHYWRTGDPLALDEEKLRRIARLSPEEWLDDGADILAFFKSDGVAFHNHRIDIELAKAVAKQAAKAEAGRKGSQKRWQTHGTGIAEPSISQSQTDAPTAAPSPVVADVGDAPGISRETSEVEKREVRAICELFNLELENHFSPEKRPMLPHKTNSITARRWIANGATAEFVRPIIAAGLVRMAMNGQSAPTALKYFEQAVADALVAAREPMPKGKPRVRKSRDVDPEETTRNDRDSILSGLARAVGDGLVVGVRDEPISDRPGADCPVDPGSVGSSAPQLPASGPEILRGSDGPADAIRSSFQPSEARRGERNGDVPLGTRGTAERPAGDGDFAHDSESRKPLRAAAPEGDHGQGAGAVSGAPENPDQAGNGAKIVEPPNDQKLIDECPEFLRRRHPTNSNHNVPQKSF